MILGETKSIIGALLKICSCVFILSIFLSNTAIVAIMIPIIEGWCITRKLPPKVFLMPLSVATIMGGSCSYIGSSVNIIAMDQA